jgi:hypothetical protein
MSKKEKGKRGVLGNGRDRFAETTSILLGKNKVSRIQMKNRTLLKAEFGGEYVVNQLQRKTNQAYFFTNNDGITTPVTRSLDQAA